MSIIEIENKDKTYWDIDEPIYYNHNIRSYFLSAQSSDYPTQITLPLVRENT